MAHTHIPLDQFGQGPSISLEPASQPTKESGSHPPSPREQAFRVLELSLEDPYKGLQAAKGLLQLNRAEYLPAVREACLQNMNNDENGEKWALLFLNEVDELEFVDDPIPFTFDLTKLSKKQGIIVEYVSDEYERLRKPIFVYGDRQIGKSFAMFVGIIKYLFSHPNEEFHYIASQGRLAQRNMEKLIKDPNLFTHIRPHLVTDSKQLYMFRNKSRIVVHNTSTSDIKGLTGHLWIDELDGLLDGKDSSAKKDTLAKALPVVRSNPKYRLLFSSNVGSSGWAYAYDVLSKSKNVWVMEYTKKDAPPQIRDIPDSTLMELITAFAGEEVAQAQLNNIISQQGLLYDRGAVMSFAEHSVVTYPTNHPYSFICTGIDVGFEHASVFTTVVYDFPNQRFVVVDITTVQNNRVTSADMVNIYKQIALRFRGTEPVLENSPVAASLRNEFISQGITVTPVAFADKKPQFLMMLKTLLLENRLKYYRSDPPNTSYLKEVEHLVHELLAFRNDKKNDDRHDSLVYALWIASKHTR